MEIDIPVWGQQIAAFVIMAVTGIIGIWKYVKTQIDKDGVKEKVAEIVHPPIVSGTDSKLMRELIDTMREHIDERGRQSQRETRAFTDLREVIIDLIEAVHVNSNASLNMLRFLKKPD